MRNIEFRSLRTNKLYELSDSPGIYCWYFSPVSADKNQIFRILTALVESQGELNTQIDLRYGLRYVSESDIHLNIGNQNIQDMISGIEDEYGEFIHRFLKSSAFPFFSRPIYIGITKHLYTRVYEQHFRLLEKYWDPTSPVSEYIQEFPEASVREVMRETREKHSFALEARVKKIYATDLAVYYTEFNNQDIIEMGITEIIEQPEEANEGLRRLEQLLQLFTDPVCGRR